MSNHTMLDGLQFVMLAVFSFRFPRIGPSSHPKTINQLLTRDVKVVMDPVEVKIGDL